MPEKPRLMWHADPVGRCHRECEAYVLPSGGYHGCKILVALPFDTVADEVGPGTPCPFALLSDVLCCGTKPDEEHRCGTCNEHEPNDRMIPGKCIRLGIQMYDDSGKNCPNYTPKVPLSKPVQTEPSDELVERCCREAFAAFNKDSTTIVLFDRLVDDQKEEYRDAIRAVLKEAQRR